MCNTFKINVRNVKYYVQYMSNVIASHSDAFISFIFYVIYDFVIFLFCVFLYIVKKCMLYILLFSIFYIQTPQGNTLSHCTCYIDNKDPFYSNLFYFILFYSKSDV